MDKRPLVSVIIPAYNRKHTLKRCIDSVLGQTYENLEIIIVDDCSTDGTMEFVEQEYGAVNETEIIYVRNDSNLGAAASRNVGVSYANGEFIAFHDSDDEWHQEKLDKQMMLFLESEPKTAAVYSRFYMNGTDSYVYPPENIAMSYKSGYIFYSLLLTPLIGMITLVMRKRVFLEIGGFNEQLHSLEDYELTIRIAQDHAILLVDEPLAVAYESENSVGKRNRDKIVTQCYIMNRYKDQLALAGLKKKKFESVYQEACLYQFEEFFCECMMKLFQDEEYTAYAIKKWEMLHPSSHPEDVDTLDISGVSSCTGCMACLNACPVQAISQQYDEDGFLVPNIDDGKCVRCGRCKEVCPVCHETEGTVQPKECYAVMGSDEIRAKSSSGGVFRILADQMTEEGGYVSGAVWNGQWQVVHIVSDDPEDVERMMSSKYVQSNVGDVYRQIEELLRQDKRVFFVGCGCQVAALRRYLGREYEHLVNADVVCHGVPSQQIFDACLKDREQIREISFRKKQILGWSSGLYVRYHDLPEYVGGVDDPYMAGFLKNWTLRTSCYDCKFKSKKYSDLTLGDFWGINELYEFDDGAGTSFVTLNTTKGAYFFKGVLPKLKKIVSLQTESVKHFNPCIDESVRMTNCREMFMEEWRHRDGRTLAQMMQAVRQRMHFDIALIYMWGINYGNALTNFALHTFLQEQGKKIVVLDNYCSLEPVDQFREFAQKHYTLSSAYFTDYDRAMLNACCDTFVVGSDQNWNHQYADYYGYGNYFLLDFVAPDKKKVSYATSFGEETAADRTEAGRELYGDFDAISVREKFGVELCRQLYDVKAEWVLDPVFLLNGRDYDRMLNVSSTLETETYIAVYFLNPTKEKRELCLRIQKALGNIKIVNMTDANLRSPDHCLRVLEYDNIKTGLTVEAWLTYMRHADFIITDSYHGTCFSMIYEKKFVTIQNRESARFETFALFPEIQDRIIKGATQDDVKRYLEEIDYEAVNERLSKEIEKSKEFILEYIL